MFKESAEKVLTKSKGVLKKSCTGHVTSMYLEDLAEV